MEPDEMTDLLGAAREMLAALWTRAMNNELTDEEARAVKRGCMAIALTDKGIAGVSPFPGWRER